MSVFRRFLMLLLMVVLLAPVGASGARVDAQRSDPPPTANWLSLDGASTSGAPTLTLINADNALIALQAELPGATVETVEVEGQRYSRLGGEGYGFGTEIGQPDLPVLRGEVEIPFGAQATVEIVAAEYTDYTLAELGLQRIYPLQPSVVKLPDAPEEPFHYDSDFYAQRALAPETPVNLGETYSVRGHYVQPVEVWPVAYNPGAGQVRLYHRVIFRLRLSGGDPALTAAQAERYASPAFETRLATQLLNYRQGRPPAVLTGQNQGRYLIITADAYYDAMQPFVTLKTSQGFDVIITRLSEISGGTTNTAIKAYIQTAYNTWSPPPSYLLLVGDTDTIPAWSSTQSSGKYTDLYYSTMDGSSDWHPDLARGRFPVRSAAQTTIMVNRYLNYINLTGEEAWLKKIEFIATCDNYTVAEGTHNYVVSTYTQPGGYTGLFPNNPQPGGDKIYCVTYNGTATQIRNAANDGRWAIIYSGHGSETGWADGNVAFSQTDVRNLTYQGIFPFVASHACVTGSFNQPESFGETWVLQENKGALVFWGSSHNTYWSEDDTLERSMFDYLFTRTANGYPNVAAMTDYGLGNVEASYPSSARYYWEAYNVLGDSSVKVFMEPENPDFQLEVTPEAQELCVADTVTYTVQLGEVLDYPYPVTLTWGATPQGVTASVAPSEVTPPGQALLTLTAAAEAADGTYTQIVTGTAQADNIHAATTTYTVNRAPDELALLAPGAGEVVTSLAPTFSWQAAPRAVYYQLQIARDAGFNDLVFDIPNIVGTSYTLSSALQALRGYFWRVRAVNGCGESAFTASRAFTTPTWPCVLLVDDDGGSSAQAAYTTALNALDVEYHVHTVSSSAGNGPTANILAQYPIVVWLTGGRYNHTLTVADQAALGGYLDGGGNLVLSSWGAGSELNGTPFLANYLRATYEGDLASGTFALTGQGVLASQPLTITASTAAQVSKLTPLNGAAQLYNLPAPYTQAAAVSYDGAYALAYLGFGLETAPDAEARQNVLGALLEWLGPCPTGQTPQASFVSNSPVRLGQAMVFTNTTLPGDPEETTYAWDFGDGIGTSTMEHPVYTYTTAGTYTVTLTATNAVGSHVFSAMLEVQDWYHVYLPLVLQPLEADTTFVLRPRGRSR